VTHPPTLSRISELFTASRGQLLGGCMKAAIEELYAPYFEELGVHCRFCGEAPLSQEVAQEDMLAIQGEFELDRPCFHCCDRAWPTHPPDGDLGLARQRHQTTYRNTSPFSRRIYPTSRAPTTLGA